MNRLRSPCGGRDAFVALALLALAIKLLFPPGFMPGTSLSVPVVVCGGQGTMAESAGMSHGTGHHAPAKQPGGAPDPSCPFAGLSATPLTPDAGGLLTADLSFEATPVASWHPRPVPGRGLAAPPPPSHAPPTAHS